MAKKSKKPTNLKISRSKTKLSFSWKTGETYKEQVLKWTCTGYTGSNHRQVLGGSTTSKTMLLADGKTAITTSNFYPNTSKKLSSIKLVLAGTAKDKTVSDSVSKTVTVHPPKAPSLTYTLDSTNQYSYTIACTAVSNDTDWYPYKDTVVETALVKNWNGKYTGVKWTAFHTVSANTSWSGTEDTSVLTNASYARLFRAYSRGAGGISSIAYAKHVYASPDTAVITNAAAEKDGSNLHVTVAWRQGATTYTPVDSMTVQYYIGAPDEDLQPAGDSISWSDAGTVARRDATCAYDFNLAQNVDADQCLWVTIMTAHDKKETYALPVCAYVGKLAKPSLTSATISGTNLTVEMVRNTSIDCAYTAVELSTESADYGIIGYTTSETRSFACPDVGSESYDVKIYNVIGKFEEKDVGETEEETEEGYKSYVLASNLMQSDSDSMGSGTMPTAPTGLSVSQKSTSSVLLSWNWTWTEATGCTISWSDDENAWMSTNEPDTFDIDTNATSWIISDLDADTPYYFRVRLKTDDINSAWSDMASFTISSDNVKPSMSIINSTISLSDKLVCACSYNSDESARYQIAEVVDGEYTIIYTGESASVSLSIEDINTVVADPWTEGSQHELVCRISTDASTTEWSDSAYIDIIPELVISAYESGLAAKEDEEGSAYYALQALPLTCSVESNGSGFLAVITRAEDITIARPDEQSEARYAGEIVAYSDDGQIELNTLLGQLDDGSEYILTLQAYDEFEQTAAVEIPFRCEWTHQPEIPTATVVADQKNKAVKITVNQPDGYVDGDTFDIYRLTADLPELVLANGEYGTTYVDPYPALNTGGYRIVNKTANGDYITADNTLAWLDVDTAITSKQAVIDFGATQIALNYNVAYSNDWKKDFEQTVYLGGSVQGDWNKAVTRKTKLSACHVTILDDTVIADMRRLAHHAGICHLRTVEGSSFACDIQVSEDRSYDNKYKVDFDLEINRVDPEGFEMMTLEEWEDIYGLE